MVGDAPTSYVEWSDLLAAFSESARDEEVLSAMERGVVSWAPGVAEMFSARMTETLSKRLSACSESLNRNMSRSGEETALLRSIFDARRALFVLHRFATLKSLPELLRTHLSAEVRRFAERAQSSLEDSAKRSRNDRLATMFRNNSLLHYTVQAASDTAQPKRTAMPAVDELPTSGVRRRNFLG